jgi:hypothetical protein
MILSPLLHQNIKDLIPLACADRMSVSLGKTEMWNTKFYINKFIIHCQKLDRIGLKID